MTLPARWPRPKPGDILWCRFPEDLIARPGPKPRPALVLAVGAIDGRVAVKVAYGTSRKTERLFPGEFAIAPTDAEAYRAAGLSYATKFNLAKQVELPYDTDWFCVAPGAPFGQSPRLGLLHPSLMARARRAFEATRT